VRLTRQCVRPEIALNSVVCCVCDVRGVLAAMHCLYDPDGVEVPDLQLVAPRLAVPVRRGIARTTPSSQLCLPAPIALLMDKNSPWAAVAIESMKDIPFEPLQDARTSGLSLEQSLRSLSLAEHHATGAAAIVRGSDANAGPHTVLVQSSFVRPGS
jgi:hypothetical protein